MSYIEEVLKTNMYCQSTMKSEFIALNKAKEEEKEEWFLQFSKGQTMLEKTCAYNKHTL